MSENETAENQNYNNPFPKEEQPKKEQRVEELKRGQMMIAIFAFLLVFIGSIYVTLHYLNPGGLLSPKMAVVMVTQALDVLEFPNPDTDSLSSENIKELNRVSVRLRMLQPQIDSDANYMTTIGNIDVELGKEEASREVLLGLFELLESIIRNGSGSYFWTGSLDRWIELGLWAFFGNLVFLLNEIKNEMETYFPQITKKEEIKGFIKPTPWYVVYFFRGPFIAMVILVALSSINFEIVGVSLNLKTSPIEVSIVLAAILGYYSRVAAAQLEIITTKFLGAAWKKAYSLSAEKELSKEGLQEDIEQTSNLDKNFGEVS